jgi:hypothetical protein
MARTPDTVNIRLHDLMVLLMYRWAATNSPLIGELGEATYDETVSAIDTQSKLEITPMQLADLIYHMKECVFGRVKPVKLDFRIKNYNRIMRRLKSTAPNMFKETAAGEVVMVELEDRVLQ